MAVKGLPGTPMERKLESMKMSDPKEHAKIIDDALSSVDHESVPVHLKMIIVEPLLKAKHFGLKGLKHPDDEE